MLANRKPFGRRLEVPSNEPPPKPLREVPELDPREQARRRVLQTGKICFGEQLAFTIDCVIHDISKGGMRVQVSTGGSRGMRAEEDVSASIPSEVVVLYFKEHAAYRASVAWRRRGSLGLRFLSEIDLKTPDTAEAKFLHQLWSEHQLRTSSTALSD